MADEGYVLSEFDAAWVVANAGSRRTNAINVVGASGLQVRLCKNGGSTIGAISGSTLSSRTCTIYTAIAGTLNSTTQTIDVYNISTAPIAANAYFVAAFVGGIWIAIVPYSTFDVRVKPDGSALQKSTDGGATWTDWATIGTC